MEEYDYLQAVESSTLEFKTSYTPYIVRNIASFLNTDGGTIVVGLRERKVGHIVTNEIVGIKNPDKVFERINYDIDNKLSPSKDIKNNITFFNKKHNDNSLLIIKVTKADILVYCENKLYFREGNITRVLKTEEDLFDVLLLQKGKLRSQKEYCNQDNINDNKARAIIQIGNLPKNNYVYKYMDLESALLSLCGKRGGPFKQTLRFVEPSFWQDQYEGRFYNADYSRVAKNKSDYPFLYACCVSTCNEDESAWNIYSYGEKGLNARCVQFIINRKHLIEQLAKNCKLKPIIYMGEVSYKNKAVIDCLHLKDIKREGTTEENDEYKVYFDNFNIGKYIQLLLLKRIAYEHEKEFRFFIIPSDAERKKKTDNVKDKKSDPYYIEVDWLEVLEGVQIDSKCSEYEKALLNEALQKLIDGKSGLSDEEKNNLKRKLEIKEIDIYKDPLNGKKITVGMTYNEWTKDN